MPDPAAEPDLPPLALRPEAGPPDGGGAFALGVLEHLREGVVHGRMLTESGRPVDFVCLYANPAFHAQTGLGPVVGRRASEVVPGIRESDPVLFDIFGRVAEGGAPETFERFIVALDQWFSVQVHSPARGTFVAVFNIVTGRKQAEQRATRALAASSTRFSTATSSAWSGCASAASSGPTRRSGKCSAMRWST